MRCVATLALSFFAWTKHLFLSATEAALKREVVIISRIYESTDL